MKQYFTIPVFIPEKACPFRCVYCNQYAIADTAQIPSPAQVKTIIDTYLATFPDYGIKKVGFFGGSFTGMSTAEQNRYLDEVLPYVKVGAVSSIQLSTRPDYISEEILNNLQSYPVETIELGVQSLDSEVLRRSGRGHSVEDVEKSAASILQKGFRLGLQMMTGLPEDTFEKSMYTAQRIIELGAHCTRIYPTLVIKDTQLEQLYVSKKYNPLSLKEAVEWSKELFKLFTKNNVTILRMGLHPSEGLINGKSLLAGPFHVSFKELVLTSLWKDILTENVQGKTGKKLTVEVAPQAVNAAVGYRAENKKKLLETFDSVCFRANDALTDFAFHTFAES
ncbi:MAG: radical SAM protein [Bacteroidales bacterium]|nr:radical SAM protein [Bacteroidales bacterium]